jgi:hypothetical protein
MSDVQVALHPDQECNIDACQITEIMPDSSHYTLVECHAFPFLRFVNAQ